MGLEANMGDVESKNPADQRSSHSKRVSPSEGASAIVLARVTQALLWWLGCGKSVLKVLTKNLKEKTEASPLREKGAESGPRLRNRRTEIRPESRFHTSLGRKS